MHSYAAGKPRRRCAFKEGKMQFAIWLRQPPSRAAPCYCERSCVCTMPADGCNSAAPVLRMAAHPMCGCAGRPGLASQHRASRAADAPADFRTRSSGGLLFRPTLQVPRTRLSRVVADCQLAGVRTRRLRASAGRALGAVVVNSVLSRLDLRADRIDSRFLDGI